MLNVKNECKAGVLPNTSPNVRNYPMSCENSNNKNDVQLIKSTAYSREIRYCLSDGQPRTVKEISKALLMPPCEVEITLKIMVRLGEVEKDEQGLTYYIIKEV